MQNLQDNHLDEKTVYAGFFIRLAAYLIDLVLVNLVLVPIRIIHGIVQISFGESIIVRDLLFQYDVFEILIFLLTVLYFILMTYCTGQTLGKMVFELRVVTVHGEKLELMNVLYRETVGRFLSSLMGVGYLLIVVGAQKNSLHDSLCDTRVIYHYRKINYQTIARVKDDRQEPELQEQPIYIKAEPVPAMMDQEPIWDMIPLKED